MAQRFRLAYLMGGLLVLGLAGCKGETPQAKDKDNDKPAVEKLEAPAPKAEIITTAEAFAKEFKDDDKAAGAKYQGKVVELAGIVRSVMGSDGGKRATVFLRSTEDPKAIIAVGVMCEMSPAYLEKSFALSKNQKVRMTGKCNRDALADCVLEELSKSETVAITAEELAKEFAADGKAASAKYADNEIVVSGVLEDLQDQKAKLKTGGKAKVTVGVRFDEVRYLKNGQTVWLRGQYAAPFGEKGEPPPPEALNDVQIQAGYVVKTN